MSIRHVKCPACGTGANVPLNIANVKCTSCGAVWNPSQASSATRSAAPAAVKTVSRQGVSGKLPLGLIAAIGGVIAMLFVIGVAAAIFISREDDVPPPTPVNPVTRVPPTTPAPVVVQQETDAAPAYREVDLPESTRKQIYLDYRRLVGSSTEKKIMIMKGSPVGQSVQGMLEQTVDREISHFSSIHNISREDIFQIVAEGDAKEWPGARTLETEISDQP